MKRFFYLVIFGAVFGALASSLGANIFNHIEVNSEHPRDRWYNGLIALLAPGAILENILPGTGDGWTGPVGDNIEGSDLRDAVFFNAMAWPVVFVVLACLLSLIYRGCRWIFLSGLFSHAR